jgi:spore photoproduct lyase
VRIGTGEFTDSLVLDKVSGFSRELIEYFSAKDKAILELKTKSAEVDHILNIEHNKKTVIGWSLNPEHIVKTQEYGTASLKNRLAAAVKCVNAGYDVAFHFDPIFFYDGWQQDYEQVLEAVFSQIPAKRIAWISLGALRLMPGLKDIIEQRFPQTNITCQELDIGSDQKLRYCSKIRIEIFNKMYKLIREYGREILVYLCMESREVWEMSGLINNESNSYLRYFKFCRKA